MITKTLIYVFVLQQHSGDGAMCVYTYWKTFICHEELGHWAEGDRVRPAVLQSQRRVTHQQPRGDQLSGHLSQLKLQELNTGNHYTFLFMTETYSKDQC